MSMPPADPTVTGLPLSDPRCVQAPNDCIAFVAATNDSQTVTPWAGQFDYGRYTTYYWVIILGVLALLRLLAAVRDRVHQPLRNDSPTNSTPSLLRKIQAAGRYVFYRRSKILSYLMAPSAGIGAFVLVAIIFLLGLTFAARPYYRMHLGYGSPPIAIRTGLMATACTPILVALAGKANIVSFLTGISHERLNVLHRWVAWMSFVLSLVHAIPFFIASYRDEGDGGFQRVQREFYYNPLAGCNEVCDVFHLYHCCNSSLPIPASSTA